MPLTPLKELAPVEGNELPYIPATTHRHADYKRDSVEPGPDIEDLDEDVDHEDESLGVTNLDDGEVAAGLEADDNV